MRRLQGRAAAHARGRHGDQPRASPARRCARCATSGRSTSRSTPRSSRSSPSRWCARSRRTRCTSAATRHADVDPDKECYPAGQGVGAIARARSRPATSCAGSSTKPSTRWPRGRGYRRDGDATRLVVVGGDAGGHERGGAGAAARDRRRARDRRVRARRLHVVRRVRHSVLRRRPRRTTSTTSIARTPEEHRAQRHRRAHAARGRRDRHRRAHGDRARPRRRRARRAEPFDQLVIATGATPVRPDLPGIDAAGVHGVQTLGDGIAPARRRRRATADDGTARSSSAAATSGSRWPRRCTTAGCAVTVVDAGAAADADARPRHGRARRRRDARARHRAAHRHRGRRRSRPTPTAACARSCTGDRHDPGRPRRARHRRRSRTSRSPRDAGHRDRPSGGIATDARMATSADGVWAAGDCVECHHRVTQPAGRDRARHAREQAGAGRRRSTRPAATRRSRGVVGTAVTKICEYEVGAHRSQRARGHATPASTSSTRDDRGDDPGRLLPGRRSRSR